MATIHVKFRASTVEGRSGTVYYQVSHRRHVRQIPTRIRVSPQQWRLLQMGEDEVDDKEWWFFTRRQIEGDMRTLHRLVQAYEAVDKDYTAEELVEAFFAARRQIPFMEFMEQQIAEMIERGHRGTARGYRRSLSSFARYLNYTDIPFSLLDKKLVEGYGDWLLRHGVVRNTLSFYMRNLRSVYNKAVQLGLSTQEYPFRQVYTGVDVTRKRAIDEQTIVRISRLALRGAEALARDLFVFSYCTRGMSFIDMAFLRKSDVRGDVISYTRRKTKQRMVIRIEPYVRRIMIRHRPDDSPYVFPLIRSTDAFVAYKQYQGALSYINKLLKRIGAAVGLQIPLTTYVARHSWASSARKHNIPLSVISAGMGHTSEQTTRIYLAALENAAIDRANSGIIASLTGRKRRY